jgi:hypothetical protein
MYTDYINLRRFRKTMKTNITKDKKNTKKSKFD